MDIVKINMLFVARRRGRIRTFVSDPTRLI